MCIFYGIVLMCELILISFLYSFSSSFLFFLLTKYFNRRENKNSRTNTEYIVFGNLYFKIALRNKKSVIKKFKMQKTKN